MSKEQEDNKEMTEAKRKANRKKKVQDSFKKLVERNGKALEKLSEK